MKVTNACRTTALVGAAVTLLTLAGCAGGSEADAGGKGEFGEEITLGAVPAENSAALQESYEPVVSLLEEETGATVKLHQAGDYAGVIEGMIADKVDIAFFGPASYVIATKNGAKIQPLGAVTPEKGKPSGYRSYGLTKAGNDDISSLSDFEGKDVCFVDSGSTSGFLYPTAGLIDSGVIKNSQEKHLNKGLNPIFSGGHDAAALAVKNGDCDAGFAFDSMVDKTLPQSGELEKGDLKKVWTSETIAGSLFAANTSLGDEAIDRLTTIFTKKANSDYLKKQGFCEGACRITDEDAWGVVPAKDSDYDVVREVCTKTKSDKCEEG